MHHTFISWNPLAWKWKFIMLCACVYPSILLKLNEIRNNGFHQGHPCCVARARNRPWRGWGVCSISPTKVGIEAAEWRWNWCENHPKVSWKKLRPLAFNKHLRKFADCADCILYILEMSECISKNALLWCIRAGICVLYWTLSIMCPPIDDQPTAIGYTF